MIDISGIKKRFSVLSGLLDERSRRLVAAAESLALGIFDYSSALAAITAQAPFLNYGVAAMPQPANATVAINYAKYNGLAVSRNSTQIVGGAGTLSSV